jgi:Ser/Thr protein kinase RdoA (MazF antagonist)
MNEQLIVRIAEKYGIKFEHFLPVEKGYRNESYPIVTTSGEMVNIILYKREPSIIRIIRNANRASDYLAQHGIPARQTLDPRIVCLSFGSWHKYAGVYNYLSGETIPWEAYTMQHIKLLGAMLSNIHTKLKDLPISGFPSVAEQYLQ